MRYSFFVDGGGGGNGGGGGGGSGGSGGGFGSGNGGAFLDTGISMTSDFLGDTGIYVFAGLAIATFVKCLFR